MFPQHNDLWALKFELRDSKNNSFFDIRVLFRSYDLTAVKNYLVPKKSVHIVQKRNVIDYCHLFPYSQFYFLRDLNPIRSPAPCRQRYARTVRCNRPVLATQKSWHQEGEGGCLKREKRKRMKKIEESPQKEFSPRRYSTEGWKYIRELWFLWMSK